MEILVVLIVTFFVGALVYIVGQALRHWPGRYGSGTVGFLAFLRSPSELDHVLVE